jgi:hypothetical protein
VAWRLLMASLVMGASRPNRSGGLPALFVALAVSSTQAVACFPSLDGLTGGDGEGPSPAQDAAAGGTSASIEDAGTRASNGDARSAPDVSPPSSGTPADDAAATTPDAARVVAAGPILFGAPTSTSGLMGGDSGALFSEACAIGAALVGLNLVVDTASPFALTQVQPVCVQVAVTPAGDLAFTSSTTLPAEGDHAGAAGALLCPPGSVVTGMSATAEKYVHAIVLECGRLVITPEPAGLTIGLAVGTLVGPFGGSGGLPVPAFQCPPPSVANALAGSAGGDGFVDSLVVGCATPSSP